MRILVTALAFLLLVTACGDSAGQQTVTPTSGAAAVTASTLAVENADTTEATTTTTITTDDDDSTATGPGDAATSTAAAGGGEAPATFWAVTDVDYEVVEVDRVTGEVLQNLGGWGLEDQVVHDIELGADGSLWLADCCEPAVGSRYRLMPPSLFDADDRAGYGTGNVASPRGKWMAHSELGQVVVTVVDGTGEIRYPADEGGPVWYTPLTWLDDELLLIGDAAFVSLLDTTTYQIVNEWEASGQVWDAATRSDGMVAALVGWEGTDLTVQIFDPSDGTEVDEFDVSDDAYVIDYDASGTYLLVVAGSGLRWYGAGADGDLGGGYIAASW